jgi:hypothetical protein
MKGIEKSSMSEEHKDLLFGGNGEKLLKRTGAWL